MEANQENSRKISNNYLLVNRALFHRCKCYLNHVTQKTQTLKSSPTSYFVVPGINARTADHLFLIKYNETVSLSTIQNYNTVSTHFIYILQYVLTLGYTRNKLVFAHLTQSLNINLQRGFPYFCLFGQIASTQNLF